MQLTVYTLKTCDTCRKALAALEVAGHIVAPIDVRRDGVSASTLRALIAEFGVETVINRRSTTWRGLSDDEKAGDPVALLQAHPTLMKRPVILGEGANFIGWGKDVQAALV